MSEIHAAFEETTSPLYYSNDSRLDVLPQDNGAGKRIGWIVVDTRDEHVELFTQRREIADAFIAGYDYRERLNRRQKLAADRAERCQPYTP